jgi:hypothetical protein
MKFFSAFLCVIGLVATVALVGCDDDVDGASFYITPGDASVEPGGSITLTAVGGEDTLTWSVSDEQLGLVTGTGRTVAYNSAGAAGINTIRVMDNQHWEASAFVRAEEGAGTLEISPDTAELTYNNQKQSFTAVGGVAPYSWTLSSYGRGAIDASGESVVYTRKKVGDNTVVLTDGGGRTASVQVTQPDAATLVVSPSSASVSTNGGVQVFEVVGGAAPFAWTIHVNGTGASTVNPATGNSTVFTAPTGTAADVIRCQDANGTIVFVTITKN